MNANEKKSYLFICYCIAGVFIINCESIWTSITTTMKPINALSWPLITLLCLLGIALKNKTENISQTIVRVVTIAIFLFIYILFCGYSDGRSSMLKLLIVVCCIMAFYYLCCFDESIPQVLVSYSNMIVFVGIISLFFWLFASVFGIIHPSGVQYSIWNGSGKPLPVNDYWNIYYETQFIKNSNLIRNSAIFTEAPVAAGNFLIAYMIQFLYLLKGANKSNKMKCLILALCILTTYSASGIIILIVTGVVLVSRQNHQNNFLPFLKFIILPLLAVVALIIVIRIIGQKMGSDITQSSGLIRMDDYAAGIKAWLHYPLFGAGIGNSFYVSQYMSLWRNFNLGLSSSFLQVISEGGIYILFLYVYCLLKGLFTSYLFRNMSGFLFALVMLVLFFVSIFSYSYLFIFILIWISSKHFSKVN